MHKREEISDGYLFRLDGQTVSLPETAEWIAAERRCCPFLRFQLSASGEQANWILAVTGPAGVKPILDAEFPVP